MNYVDEPLNLTLRDAVDFLNSEAIDYALIGGLAASLRGRPRVTADVDFVIAADVDRAMKLVAALGHSRFMPLLEDVEEVVQRSFILPLQHRATGLKVDIALGLSGFEQQAIARVQRTELDGVTVNVATAEDLLIMKLIAGRPRDDQDVGGILEAQGENLDWDYCEHVAENLGLVLG